MKDFCGDASAEVEVIPRRAEAALLHPAEVVLTAVAAVVLRNLAAEVVPLTMVAEEALAQEAVADVAMAALLACLVVAVADHLGLQLQN